MSDPLLHDDLVSYTTRLNAARLEGLIGHVLHEEPLMPALVGITLAFLAACDEAEVDPRELLDQVEDASDAGSLSLTSAENEQLDLPFSVTH